jgi:SpoVK/Ycf46/Vps4 family AAA+-type ATPase
MVGNTDHLERLDPGIAKRPSRFDRKVFFTDPNLEQRVKYCHFWQTKLRTGGNEDIEFPDRLCLAIANITDGFSFAYIQEAFMAALVVIEGRKRDGTEAKIGGESAPLDRWEFVEEEDTRPANAERHSGGDGEGPDLDTYLLWSVIKEQVAMLRKELNDKAESAKVTEWL